MSKEYLPTLFEPFSREYNTTAGKVGGTGLGMPIVKKMVDLMGGSLEVESELGKGTVFTFTLMHKIADEKYYGQKTETADASGMGENLHGKHVLLAEDNDLNEEIAIALLGEKGMTVTRTVNGKSALTQFCNTAPGTFNLILMDIMMPEMNGYETTKAIRNLPDRPDGKEIPIIAMTANAFAEDVQAALNAGMNDHVAKPIDMDILISVITKYKR